MNLCESAGSTDRGDLDDLIFEKGDGGPSER